MMCSCEKLYFVELLIVRSECSFGPPARPSDVKDLDAKCPSACRRIFGNPSPEPYARLVTHHRAKFPTNPVLPASLSDAINRMESLIYINLCIKSTTWAPPYWKQSRYSIGKCANKEVKHCLH